MTAFFDFFENNVIHKQSLIALVGMMGTCDARVWRCVGAAFGLLLLLAGCSSRNAGTPTGAVGADAKALAGADFQVDYHKGCRSDGLFARVLRDGDRWTIDEVALKPLSRGPEAAEVLCVRRDFKLVEPAFTAGHHWKENVGWFECSPIVNDLSGYGGCNSQLTSVDVVGSVGKNIFAAALSFGLASGTNRNIDETLIRRIVAETDLFARLRRPDVQVMLEMEKIEKENQAWLAEQARSHNEAEMVKALGPRGLEPEIARAIFDKLRYDLRGGHSFAYPRPRVMYDFQTRTRWFRYGATKKEVADTCTVVSFQVLQFARAPDGQPIQPAERELLLQVRGCDDHIRPEYMISRIDVAAHALLP